MNEWQDISWWSKFKKWFISTLPDGDSMIAADMQMNGYTDFDIEEANKKPEYRMGKYVKAYVCDNCKYAQDWLFIPSCCPECGCDKFNFIVGQWKEVKQICHDGLYVKIYWSKVAFIPNPPANGGDV